MKKFTLKSLLIITLAIIPMTFYGQEETKDKLPFNNWFVGIEGGATTMFGDNQKLKMDQTSWDAGLFLGYTFNNTISLYGDFGYVNLKGKYDNFFTIDECNLFQASINLGYNILQLFEYIPNRRGIIMPHVGLGSIMHKSTTTFANGKVITNGYNADDAITGNGLDGRKVVNTIHYGIKFGYSISKHFDANIDLHTIKLDSDNLDNFRSGRHSDFYAYANVSLVYKFGFKYKQPCPDCPECEPTTPDCEACKDAIQEAVKEAVEEALKNNQPAPAAAQAEEAQPETAESLELRNFEEKDIHLLFKVGTAEMVDSWANREQLRTFREEVASRDIQIIKTIGYASPEGNDQQNQQLSESRARATANYIKQELGSKAKDIKIDAKGLGSDWEGFYTALENSDIPDRDKIAYNIKNSENPNATLNQMRAKYPELNDILRTLRVTHTYINK